MSPELNPFPPADEAEWRRRVEQALGGITFESLITETFEGLKIAPLYPRPAGDAPRALRQNYGPWKISQRMDHPDAETANAMAREDLAGGADALTVIAAPAQPGRGFGVRIEGLASLDKALAGIDLDLIQLRLDAGPRALDLAASFASLASARRLASAKLDADFGYDPIGHLARTGRLPLCPNLSRTHFLLREAGFTGHLILADGRPYHEAGAGEAQELACVIATGVEYLRLLEEEGLPLEEAREEIAFLLAADASELLCLAKFRALRRLWAHIESACGLAPKPLRLHAETSFRMMTRYDPWVNILRAAMGVFAAGLGGADSVTVLPFTLALGLPDDFARRIARNTQLILIHEGKLAKVADPAAGAGSFEALTEDLCARAWSLLQSFEAQGGMISALRMGLPQSEIATAAFARRHAIARRSRAITGTSAFPDLAETPVPVLEPSPAALVCLPVGEECAPLLSLRDAEPYERLRAIGAQHFEKTGERPRIFLFLAAAAQESRMAADFARGFFAVAGIEAVQGEAPGQGPAAFIASGCKAACICASPAHESETLIEIARMLRRAGAARVYLAGHRRIDAEAALRAAGVDEFVCIGCDALSILEDTLTAALGQIRR
ncbi:MAG TPA: methylmalonyl-CoA mutase subunit beta [Methylocella sp.]|nr:methylmalonyl-CoA mutase subunit beta [Methylocella sp.]